MSTHQDLLKKSGLRITQPRQKILDIFFNTSGPQSLSSLENALSKEMDRATIYRNLLTLSDKGIIHGVTGNQGTQYLLSSSTNHPMHPHFKCLSCDTLSCIEVNTSISLPENYSVKNINWLIEGHCPSCNSNIQ